MDGVKDKVGYIMIEITSDPVLTRVWFSIRLILLSCRVLSGTGTASVSGEGSPNLSRASPLNFSLNFRFLQIRLSKLCFFLSSRLILFFVFGALLGGGEARIGGGEGGIGGGEGLVGSQVWG